MMHTAELNTRLHELLDQRLRLKNLGYDHPDYDPAEEQLEAAEDAFVETYGAAFEQILQQVHEQFCRRSDVLLPTAYLPRTQYTGEVDAETGLEEYEIGEDDGVWVTLNDFPDLDAKLVLLPSPPRLVLVSVAGSQEVWVSE